MIRGVHTMFYSSDAEALRAFIRDKLGFPSSDVGGGWLIFDLPEAEMGCHPAGPKPGASAGTHDVSFYCDDIEETMAELQSRGVDFIEPVTTRGFGLVTRFRMPGDVVVQLYQPLYAKRPSSICGVFSNVGTPEHPRLHVSWECPVCGRPTDTELEPGDRPPMNLRCEQFICDHRILHTVTWDPDQLIRVSKPS